MSFSNLSVDIQNNLVKLFWDFTGDASNFISVRLQIAENGIYSSPIFSEILKLNRSFVYPDNIFVKNTKYTWRLIALSSNFAISFYHGPTFIYTGQTPEDLCIPMWPEEHWSDTMWPLGMWPDCVGIDDTTDDPCHIVIATDLISEHREVADLITSLTFFTNLLSLYEEESNIISNFTIAQDLTNLSIPLDLSPVQLIVSDVGAIFVNTNSNLLNSVNISSDMVSYEVFDSDLSSEIVLKADLKTELVFDGEICDGC